MKIVKVISVLFLIMTSSSISAAIWSGGTEVLEIYPHTNNNVDGTIYFRFGKMVNPSNCQRSDMIALKKSNKVSSELYSLILTAFTTGKRVNYYVETCDQHGYPELIHAKVSKLPVI
ncbi:hypothetical protein [uncultured Photobacterium sp.]|uniref:hypothetical protein n=1 Tax=uncultured Photobacterium sp. TaxID=173973 RepID=UPI00260BAB11|nr:hypothetical protein [uncultured Photobacterium sp.]